MANPKRFLVDVGMRNLPFPIRAVSKVQPEGQATVASITINARIMQEFEARSIDTFVRILHRHRECIGTKTLRENVVDYVKELQASTVVVDFDYPFFIEKCTPVSKEKCLVRYMCKYSARYLSIKDTAKILFSIDVPAITTYPVSFDEKLGGLFGQLSLVHIETASEKDVYPEDLVDLVDRHAVMPVYSFLTEDDQKHIIRKVHSEGKSSVVMTDEIKDELARSRGIDWFSVKCSNFGMLHSYSTVVSTEKSVWVPMTSVEDTDI